MKQPLLVTAAIIRKDNRLLLVKRAKEPFKGCWSLIGGCGLFEKTSDPLEAVKGEVLVDIDCKFKPEFFMYNFETFEVLTVTLFFHGVIEGNPVVNPLEVLEVRWFDKNELSELDLAFDHSFVLKKYFEKFPLE